MIDFPASPTVGQLFSSGALSYRYDGHAWLGTPPAGVMTIPDAPNDGVVYGRQSQAWVPVSASGGGGVWIGDTAPTDTTKYPFWWSSTSLQLSIWYNDGNSSQWVDTNGAPSSPPGAWLLQDGTVVAPGLAWANEPGLGLYRKSASVIGVAAQGSEAVELDASGAGTYITAYTKSNAGAQLRLFNNAPGAASFNYLNLYLNPDGNSGLVTNAIGGALRAPFTLAVPQVLFSDGNVAAPGISFASEPGLGWFRQAPSAIATVAQGSIISSILRVSASEAAIGMSTPSADGTTHIDLTTRPYGVPNYSMLRMGVNNTSGHYIQEVADGGATQRPLNITFPAGVNINGGYTTVVTPPASDRTGKAMNTAFLGTEMSGTINATTGWQKFPFGTIIQWGSASQVTDGGGNMIINLPTPFSLLPPISRDCMARNQAYRAALLAPTIEALAPHRQTQIVVHCFNSTTGAAMVSAALTIDWMAFGF